MPAIYPSKGFVLKQESKPSMASEVTRKAADDLMMEGNQELCTKVSSETFTKDSENTQNFMQPSASQSSYTLADDRSHFSRNVDRWMSGNTSVENTGVQGSRVAVVQRSVLARSSSLEHSGMWYILAMVLPLFSINTCTNWRCSPSLVLNTAELLMAQMSSVCSRVREHIHRMAQDQMARELLATAMDIVLVIYAIGFLVISMYQASIFR